MNGSSRIAGLSSEDILRVQSSLDEFEEAWKETIRVNSQPPRLCEYVIAGERLLGNYCLVQLVAIDIEYRFRSLGTQHCHAPCQVEEYLREYPQLGDHPSWVIELVTAEYRCLCRNGRTPRIEEYLTRFSTIPGLSTELQLASSELQSEGSVAQAKIEGFRLLAEAGRGGRGVIYKAWQESLKRLVAIKVLKPACQESEEERTRFRREGETLASLQHPNIVKVFAVQASGPQHLLIMEWISGRSLDDLLRSSEIVVTKVIEIVMEVCSAVEYAHQHGVLHRDIKPGNILITDTGEVRVTDFGLAKHVHSTVSTDFATLTQTREILGTPGFMPPEQIDSHQGELGPWTDVYAIGATLYFALTGRPPLRGSTVWETFQLILSEDPVNPIRLNPQVSRDLETVCMKCLAKRPERRYQSAADLRADLRRLQAGEPIAARSRSHAEKLLNWAQRHPREAWLSIFSAASIVLFMIFLMVGFLFYGRLYYREQAERVRASQALEAVQASEYASRIREARLQFQLNNLGGMHIALNEVLRGQSQTDRRDWEWYYLQSLSEHGSRRFQAGSVRQQWVGALDLSHDLQWLVAGTTVPWYESMDQKQAAQLIAWHPDNPAPVWTVELPGNACTEVTINETASLVAACVHQADRAQATPVSQEKHLAISYQSSSTQLLLFDLKEQVQRWSLSLAEKDLTRIQFAGPFILLLSNAGLSAHRLSDGSEVWRRASVTGFKLEGRAVRVMDPSEQLLGVADGLPCDESQIAANLKETGLKKLLTFREARVMPSSQAILHFSNRSGAKTASACEDHVTLQASGNSAAHTIKVDSPVSMCSFSSDDNLLAVGRADGIVELWSLDPFKKLQQMPGHKSQITQLQFADHDRFLLSGSWDGDVLMRQINLGDNIAMSYGVSTGSEEAFETFTLSAEGKLIGLQLRRAFATQWPIGFPDSATNPALPCEIARLCPGRSASIAADGQRVVFVGSTDRNRVICQDMPSGKQIFELRSEYPVRNVEISHSGLTLACVNWGLDSQGQLSSHLRVVNTEDGHVRFVHTATARRIWRTAINEERNLLAVLETEPLGPQASPVQNKRTELIMLNLETGHELWRHELAKSEGLYLGLTLTRDGSRVAVGEFSGEAHIRDAVTGKILLQLEQGMENLEHLAFSPNSRRLVGVSRKELILWDAFGSYRLLSLPMAQTNFDPIFNPQAQFSLDGRSLIMNGFDQVLRIITLSPNAAVWPTASN